MSLPLLMLLSCTTIKGHMSMRVVDLTHAQSQDTIYWPGNPDYNFTHLFRGPSGKGYWYESNYFGIAEHTGTHLDAPAHLVEGMWRTANIPLEHLIGPGVIVDVSDKAFVNPDYRVTVQDLKEWEAKYGEIPPGAVVIMNSGWDKNYPNKSLTFGTNTPTDPSTFHFPGFHEDAADWLVRYRNIHVVGVDTPSTDYGQSSTFPVHVILGKANIPGLENLANLNKIPPSGTTVFVAVIKLYDGSGGPARTFATIMEGNDVGAAYSYCPNIFLLLCVFSALFV